MFESVTCPHCREAMLSNTTIATGFDVWNLRRCRGCGYVDGNVEERSADAGADRFFTRATRVALAFCFLLILMCIMHRLGW